MATEKMKQIIDETISSYDQELRSINLEIHNNPELGNQEFIACRVLTEFLEKEGFEVTRQVAGLETSFMAKYTNGKPGRRVAFCSEYDALPGIGHACGHNLIAIAGVACALAIKKLLESDSVSGTVYLFGTPAEETTYGKINFIQAGLVKELCDVSMMLHPAPYNACYAKCLALDNFTIEYFGEESHAGAAPWLGVNAVDAMMLAFNNVALLRQQTITSNRVHGIITHGGDAPNVIPAYSSAKFYLRAVTSKELLEFKPRVENCFRAAALATGCTYKLTWTPNGRLDNVFNNDFLSSQYIKYMKEEGEFFNPRSTEETWIYGSTDFGNISHIVPSLHPLYDIGTNAANHTKEFTKATGDEEGHRRTLIASRSLAKVASDILLDDTMYKEVLDVFENGRK